MTDLESLLDRLVEHKVEFVVIGGFAAAAYGSPLSTYDIDICCRFSVDNLMRLQAAFGDLHPVHRMTPARLPFRLTSEACHGLKNLYLDTDYGQVDCLSTVEGIGNYEDVVRESLELELSEGKCRVVTIDALIRSKLALGRPKDIEAARHLKTIKERLETESKAPKEGTP